jgi:hypothetical protein
MWLSNEWQNRWRFFEVFLYMIWFANTFCCELDALWCTRQAWQDFGNVELFCVCAWSMTMVLDGIMASNYGRNFLS